MKILGRLTAVICSLAFAVTALAFPCGAEEYDKAELLKTAKQAVSWECSNFGVSYNEMFSGELLENAGSERSDWIVIGVSRLGFQEDYGGYLSALEKNISDRYKENGGLDTKKSTEWDREILAVLACGGNPTAVGGINLVADGIFERSENSIDVQGVNGWIWALIGVNSLEFEFPENAEFQRELIVKKIISAQCEDGGFALSGNQGDCDLTAMAVIALSVDYRKCEENTVSSLDRALEFLSINQQKDGSYSSCETTAQVLTALCSVGIDFESDDRFIKEKGLLEGLMKYRNSDGGFAHNEGEKSSEMATAQAVCSLGAVVRYKEGLRNFYDFTSENGEAGVNGCIFDIENNCVLEVSDQIVTSSVESDEKGVENVFVIVSLLCEFLGLAMFIFLYWRKKSGAGDRKNSK